MSLFSRNLKIIREIKSFSVEDLAKKLGVHRQSVYDWQDGKSWPSQEKLDKIADTLGIKVYELFLETPITAPVNSEEMAVQRRIDTTKLDLLTLEVDVLKKQVAQLFQEMAILKDKVH